MNTNRNWYNNEYHITNDERCVVAFVLSVFYTFKCLVKKFGFKPFFYGRKSHHFFYQTNEPLPPTSNILSPYGENLRSYKNLSVCMFVVRDRTSIFVFQGDLGINIIGM